MNIKYQLRPLGKILSAALCVIFSTQSFVAHASNPVSTAYVDRMILETIASSRLRAGNGISILADVTADLNEIAVTPELAIGDMYQGGVVFYLDDTKRHGLAVAINGTTNARFYSAPSPQGATPAQLRLYTQANGVGAGRSNTITMTNAQSVSSVTFGATVGPTAMAQSIHATTGKQEGCTLPEADASSSTGTTGDVELIPDCVGGWYLPSVQEMFLLAGNIFAVNPTIQAHGGTPLRPGNGDPAARYWTSSTINSLTNPLGGTYTTPGQAAYYVQIGTTITTAIPAPSSEWSAGVTGVLSARWIRQF